MFAYLESLEVMFSCYLFAIVWVGIFWLLKYNAGVSMEVSIIVLLR